MRGIVRGAAIATQPGAVYTLDAPARIAAWAQDDTLLIVQTDAFTSTERVGLLALETGAVRALTTRASSPLLPELANKNAREIALAAPESPNVALIDLLPTGDPAHAYVDGAVRTRIRPHGPERLVFRSSGALLVGAAGPPCVWRINRDAAGVLLPLVDAAWSSDGRYLAALVQTDPLRLGATHVRVIDTESGLLTPFDTGAAPVGGIGWRPQGTQVLLTIADQAERSSYESLHLLDVRTAALAPISQIGAQFSPSYWGAQFSTDGARLAVACAAPKPDQPLTDGRVCLFDLPVIAP